ncbi:MAG: hypothetical protein MUC36_19600 [Planctomycetes bacterium]|jgi:hypothetical protein|nr:hypothetical protein [Planctomycetota bacterium]
MSKVIVERARVGACRLENRPPLRDEGESPPVVIGVRRDARLRGGQKELNENLRPLQRYLHAQVGRPWDDVWSEICSHVKLTSAVQKHVRDHIPDFVAITTWTDGGQVWVASALGPKLLSHSWHRLFVDPATGLLAENPSPRRLRRCPLAVDGEERWQRMRVISATRQLHLLADGAWWDVTLAPIPRITVREMQAANSWRARVKVVDVVHRAGLSTRSPRELYGLDNVYAIDKRQLSKRDMRRLGLR